MLNAKRIFFIVLSNVGVRLFRLGIYSTSNSQSASAPRVFERAHAQKHPSTNGHDSTLIKRERTTRYTDTANTWAKSLWIRGARRRLAESDIDVVADVEPSIGLDFVTLADKLEELTGHKIDLVSRRAIKPLLWKQIERELIDV